MDDEVLIIPQGAVPRKVVINFSELHQFRDILYGQTRGPPVGHPSPRCTHLPGTPSLHPAAPPCTCALTAPALENLGEVGAVQTPREGRRPPSFPPLLASWTLGPKRTPVQALRAHPGQPRPRPAPRAPGPSAPRVGLGSPGTSRGPGVSVSSTPKPLSLLPRGRTEANAGRPPAGRRPTPARLCAASAPFLLADNLCQRAEQMAGNLAITVRENGLRASTWKAKRPLVWSQRLPVGSARPPLPPATPEVPLGPVPPSTRCGTPAQRQLIPSSRLKPSCPGRLGGRGPVLPPPLSPPLQVSRGLSP
ncbi:homeobox protein CDX-1-like [Lepus europaeus]|uniref:homeobox protein CDX-1-like n=1 Tax=Lepus europaeus TaxID=9983 RepID=UPI002B499C93|nr:homeobox protein CDX-1-like [Lepus europaeus]